MFCEKCGKELLGNETFCSKCGPEVIHTPVQEIREDDVVIRRIDCASSGKIKAIMMIICAVFIAVEGVIYTEMGNSVVESMGKFFIFLAVALAVLGVYSGMLYQKRFCLLKNNSVCGVSCGTIDLVNEKFEFNYSDVISVQKKKLMQIISVQTKYTKVNIFLPSKELNSVYELLLQKTNKHF